MEDQRRRITKAKMSLMRWGDFALFSGVLAMGKITVTTDIPTAHMKHSIKHGDI